MQSSFIGLAGAAGSGKDTVAAMLDKHFGYFPYAFAKPLKDALNSVGIFEPASREDKETLIKGRSYSYRTAAQTLGTEWARNLDKDFWLTLAKHNTNGRPLVVVSDVRFVNEADWIRQIGGRVWHIDGRLVELAGSTKSHKSEIALPRFPTDAVLDNSGDIKELESQVFALINQ